MFDVRRRTYLYTSRGMDKKCFLSYIIHVLFHKGLFCSSEEIHHGSTRTWYMQSDKADRTFPQRTPPRREEYRVQGGEARCELHGESHGRRRIKSSPWHDDRPHPRSDSEDREATQVANPRTQVRWALRLVQARDELKHAKQKRRPSGRRFLISYTKLRIIVLLSYT